MDPLISAAVRQLSEDNELTTLTVVARDPDGKLKKLLEAIQKAGNVGHSFTIVVDPGDERYESKHFWDGDGPDRIKEIR